MIALHDADNPPASLGGLPKRDRKAKAPEVWRPVVGFHEYLVSDQGRVQLAGAYVLHDCPNHGGYRIVYLRTANGKRVARRVHLLVLEAFRGPRPSPRHHGAHAPNRDKRDNRLENLRWALPEENEADKRAHGTQPKGGRVWRPNKERIARIRAAWATGEMSLAKIAKQEGLHRSSVSRIVRGLRRKSA